MSASLRRRNLHQMLEAGENMVGLSIIFSTLVPFMSTTQSIKSGQCFSRSTYSLMESEFTLHASSLEAAEIGLDPQVALRQITLILSAYSACLSSSLCFVVCT